MRTFCLYICFISFVLFTVSVEAKRVRVTSFEDFANNCEHKVTYVVSTKVDCFGKAITLAPGSKVFFKNKGAIYNVSLILKGDSKIINGRFYIDKDYIVNDVVILEGNYNKILNTHIDGGLSRTRFGISAFNAKYTEINGCIVSNIGNSENNTGGVRFDGDCSYSSIINTSITNINALTNASGIAINQIAKQQLYSLNIIVERCTISNVLPSVDGDGIKILQNHLPANHRISHCCFFNCAKRAIKIQGKGVQCIDNYVYGGCSESIIDYQNGDCFINGLKAENLEEIYAGLYIQGSEGPVVIKNVDIIANNTNKKYVRGIKIKRSSWDMNTAIPSIDIDNCNISRFYMTMSITGFSMIEDLTINNCVFQSVVNPIDINVPVSKLRIKNVVDCLLAGERQSLSFPLLNECRVAIVEIEKNDRTNN